jgi:hypothetical protein
MHCLFYLACFLAVLQSALAGPTIAPRADTAATKGHSDEKCWGSYSYSCFGSGLYSFNSLAYPWSSLYGAPSYLPYDSLLNYSGYPSLGGLWKKDASDAGKTPSTSVSFISIQPCHKFLSNWLTDSTMMRFSGLGFRFHYIYMITILESARDWVVLASLPIYLMSNL